MKFYRLRTGRHLFSFGDGISEVPIYGRPLREVQFLNIQSLGHELLDVASEDQIEDENYFIFEDDLVFSQDFIK